MEEDPNDRRHGARTPGGRQALAPRAKAAIALLAVALVLGAPALFGVTLFACPLASGFHVPCPGCGLGRSVLATLRGDLSSALAWHAFGPLALAGLVALALIAFLPAEGRLHRALVLGHERLERSRVPLLLAFALCTYWLIRLGLGAFLSHTDFLTPHP